MASKGTPKFIMQRTSAILLLPLIIWFLVALISQLGASQAQMQSWLSQPVNSILMAGLVIVGAFHMRIGMGEIIEDYIHGSTRSLLLGLNTVATTLIGGVAAVSALSLVFA